MAAAALLDLPTPSITIVESAPSVEGIVHAEIHIREQEGANATTAEELVQQLLDRIEELQARLTSAEAQVQILNATEAIMSPPPPPPPPPPLPPLSPGSTALDVVSFTLTSADRQPALRRALQQELDPSEVEGALHELLPRATSVTATPVDAFTLAVILHFESKASARGVSFYVSSPEFAAHLATELGSGYVLEISEVTVGVAVVAGPSPPPPISPLPPASPPPSTHDADDDNSLTEAAVVGIVFGTVIFVCGGLASLLYLRSRRRATAPALAQALPPGDSKPRQKSSLLRMSYLFRPNARASTHAKAGADDKQVEATTREYV